VSSKLASLRQIASSAEPQKATEQRQVYLQSVSSLSPESEVFALPFPLEQVATKNVENLVGSIAIPLGIAGPLLIESEEISGECYLPFATTEGALVASVSRGCKALNLSGGVSTIVERRGMSRSPVFACSSGKEAQKFLAWMESNMDKIQQIAESTSSHLKLLSHHSWIRGRHVYVRFAFDTQDAMGMNMVTIALEEALREALKKRPEIHLLSLSSNVCTDKKDSALNTLLGRGYWVQPEAFLSREVLKDVLKTTPERMLRVHIQKNLVGSNIARSESQNAHVANTLSAMFIATGQDPAHVVDGSQASLTIEAADDGLYCALTLPSMNVGVVGGGTNLPSQKQARSLILPGTELSAPALAAVIGSAALAGEISLLASLAEHSLASSHARLGRGKRA
jgi:hydroxymethylglutaryl-CoA reductase (NADPH)